MFINWRGVLAGVSVGFIVLLFILYVVNMTTDLLNEWWLQCDQESTLVYTALFLFVGGIFIAYKAFVQTCKEYSR